MIPFNKPAVTGKEIHYLQQALHSEKLSGDGEFCLRCHRLLEEKLQVSKALLTPSGTAALEMAALLINIQAGDEVIMPSFTFVSTANAFVLRGATPVFVDIRPDTLNINEELIEAAITSKTRAIVPVHYAGVACEMDKILALAEKYKLWVIEDTAHAIFSQYKGRMLGSLGHLACLSFHETKNYSCGEGGAILVNDSALSARAEIIREKGTNRSQFFRGEASKYSWLDLGSSYLPSELQAAYLCAHLENAREIAQDRMQSWQYYYQGLQELAHRSCVELPCIPADTSHNAHLFYLKTRDAAERDLLIQQLAEQEIHAVFHYLPLHDSVMGRQCGRFVGQDQFTTSESSRLLRLPLYYRIERDDQDRVMRAIQAFYA